jgi:AcrR family transcriptional regulator
MSKMMMTPNSVMPGKPEKTENAGRRPTRQQRRYSKTRARLIEAARAVFSEKGLDLTTIDDITQRADLGRGTFYYHFGTKARLINELIQSIIDELNETLVRKCQGHTDLPEMLDALIGAHVEFFSQRWKDFVLYFQGRADLTLEQGYEGLETPFLEYIKTVEELVDSTSENPIPPAVIRRMACAIVGFISGYYSFAVVTTDGDDVDRSFASLKQSFVVGLTRFIRETLPDEKGNGNPQGIGGVAS